MTKHTKGKWEVMFMSAGKNNIYVDPTMPRLIATTWDGWTSREEAEANARLIKNAPEMYELLKDMSIYTYACGDLESPEDCIEMARFFLRFKDRSKALITEIEGE